MKPTTDKILVKHLPHEKQTAAGIILPDQQIHHKKGEVLEVGPQVAGIKKGDTIKWDKNRGIEIEYNGEKCYFISQNQDGVLVL